MATGGVVFRAGATGVVEHGAVVAKGPLEVEEPLQVLRRAQARLVEEVHAPSGLGGVERAPLGVAVVIEALDHPEVGPRGGAAPAALVRATEVDPRQRRLAVPGVGRECSLQDPRRLLEARR